MPPECMPGLLNVTYRYCPVFVPHRIAFDGTILLRSEAKGEHEVSFEQKATEETKLCFLRCLLFKTYFNQLERRLYCRCR